MQEKMISDLDDATVEAWRDRGLVVLAGALVSGFEPTNAPDGSTITEGLWDLIFGPARWPRLKKDFRRIPFEALMHLYPDPGSLKSRVQKLYETYTPNPVHRCLADQLLAGRLCALLTTNYDLAFETCLAKDARCVTLFDVSTYEAAKHLPRPARVFFKIHGTAMPGHEDTLVYSLEREGLLEHWKRELLLHEIEDRVLLILGYSGRDFDICPILATEARAAKIVWLQRSPDISPGAARVLSRTDAVLVLGDLVELLRRLFDPSLTAKRCASKWDAASAFDAGVIRDWRLKVLNRLACGRYGVPAAETLPSDDPQGQQLRASMYAHVGRYRDSVREAEKLLQRSGVGDVERARLMVSVAGGWFIYGRHVHGYRLLRRAERWIESTPSLGHELWTQTAETRMMMTMRVAQVARWLPRWVGGQMLLGWIRETCRGTYERGLAALEEAGAWDAMQALQHNAERIGISRLDRLPLAGRDGYRSLGLVSLDVIAGTRDVLREPPWRLGPQREALARSAIKRARFYGWQHELWKLNWLVCWRGNWTKPLDRLRYLHHFVAPFWKTQYSLTGRVLQPLLNLIPQRP